MHASVVIWEFLVIGAMAFGSMAVALILAAWLTRDEQPQPTLASHTVRNASEAFAALGLSTMLAAMVFVLIPILFVMTPFFVFAAWTLLEPPRPVRYV